MFSSVESVGVRESVGTVLIDLFWDFQLSVRDQSVGTVLIDLFLKLFR